MFQTFKWNTKMRGVIEVDLGDISPVNLSLCQSNLLRKSNLVEPIEPIILQSSLCVDKSEQEAASLCYQAEKAEYIYSDLVNCHSLAHSDSSSSQATIVSPSLSKELSVSLPCRSSSSSLATCPTSFLPLRYRWTVLTFYISLTEHIVGLEFSRHRKTRGASWTADADTM